MLSFAHPGRLWLLVALGPGLALAAWGSRRRLRDWRALGQSGRPTGDGSRAWLAAMALLVPALAQPRWGRAPGAEAPPGHDVVLLVDASRSMAAEDAVPDRMGLAIGAASGLVRALGGSAGNRVAVVAFAGRGVLRCPLTGDLDAAIDALRDLKPGGVRPGGTDLGAGLEAAVDAFDDEDHAEGRTIVIFSDGEDHAGSWASAPDRLRSAGILVHSVAIGDPDRGHPVPLGDRARPKKGEEKPADTTRRSDVAFEALARATGGAVIPLGLASTDLGALYRDRIEPTARRRREAIRLPERAERFPAFVLAALAVGLAGSSPGLGLGRGRGRRFRLAFATAAWAVAGPSIGAGSGGGTPASLVAGGLRSYEAGRFAEALGAFEEAAGLAPDAAIPRYDAAATLFRLGRHAEAVARYGEARERGDGGLAIKIDYALGNAHLALGDVAGSLPHYDACLGSTLAGPAYDAIRRDAALNRAFAASRIEPPPEEPDRGDPRPGGPDRPRPSPDRSRGRGRGDGDGASSPGEPGRSGRAGDPGGGGGPRGAGGAGGEGQAPPGEGSPQSRLDAALRDVRESRRLRAPEPEDPPSGRVVKDW